MLSITALSILLTLILGLPLFGLLLTGHPLPTQLTLFPIPTEPGGSSISYLVWGLLAVIITATVTLPIRRLVTFAMTKRQHPEKPACFPLWGWLAVLGLICSWILAWARFSWFAPWQPHTFPLLWLSYIALLNAHTYQRSHQCLMTFHPWFLGQLFLLSAGFWWTFEYLNQYVNNWHYVNIPETSHLEYVLYTSIAFSTVLPAILSTYEWLATFPCLTRPFEHWHRLSWLGHQKTCWAFLSLGSVGLGLIGIWPTVLFPLLWVSPLCLLLGIQCIRKAKTSFHSLAQGDWRPIILSALAGLVCGFWWELWNIHSLVHWEYTIPYVHTFKIFKMPILGYAGYLPFGLTCVAITEYALHGSGHRAAMTGSEYASQAEA